MFLDGIAHKVWNSKDYSTLSLWIPKMVLSSMFLWPGSERTFICLIFIGCIMFLSSGILTYFMFNISDYEKATSSLCMACITFQALFKMPMLLYHSKKWDSVLQDIRSKFWPFHILDDEELEDTLKNVYFVVVIIMVSELVSGIFFLGVFVPAPLLFGIERTLPFPAKYFFDWSVSPIYELMYCFQSILLGYQLFLGATGMDFLLLTVGTCVSSQYRILQCSLLKFDKANISRINEKFKKLGEEDNPDHNEEKKYLVRCIKHHQLLLKITRIFNECSSPVGLFQLCLSMIGICLGTFEMTKAHSTLSHFTLMFIFLFVFTLELAMYCGIGNELKYQASLLPQCIYLSNWNEATQAMKNDIMFVLAKTQELTEVTTYDLYTIDFNLFIKVLKISFSGYTLLSKMSNK